MSIYDDECDDFDSDDDYYEDDYYDLEEEGSMDFQDPGGNSALRRATSNNPRIYPCPECGQKNRLTPKDVNLDYVCDQCADQAECGF